MMLEQNMISKCANPDCDAEFRYFCQGRLFAYEVRNAQEPCRDVPAVICKEKPGHATVYFWLCAGCSAQCTLQFALTTGLKLIPLPLNLGANEVHQQIDKGGCV
jgi:hypothetical protein